MLISNLTLMILIISGIANLSLIFVIAKAITKSQLKTVFMFNLLSLLICFIGLIAQILLSEKFNIPPIYFDYIVYVGTCFLPVTVFLTGQIFVNTKIKFTKKYLLLFIIPIISLLVLWTNDYHHLFYIDYSVNLNECIAGPYLTVHNIYSYVMLFAGIIYLLRYTIKNAGFFSKQSLLIVFGVSVPIVVNILGTFKIIPMTIYITPITFAVAIFCFALAIFKFQFLGVAPIALQKVVDRISDAYIVLNNDGAITDFNKTFVTMFKLKEVEVRNKNFLELLQKNEVVITPFEEAINKVKNSAETVSFEQQVKKITKWFTVEINTISNKGNFLGTLILFKDITQHILDVETIKNNQETLIEKERLASLGQMIGGIAHNLKTPIMSISGATQGIIDLAKEYDASIENTLVTKEDHHQIANEMLEWTKKIQTHTEYMSDVITAVKGQAVSLSEQQEYGFTIEELVKHVNILMKHELKNAIVYLNVKLYCSEKIEIDGNINSLVQVINNIISNAIQAYGGKPEQNIDMEIYEDEKSIVISIKDYGPGIPKNVKDKLFKEMITTKGKDGTGLGLYMSYSNIRAHFNGNMTVESEEGKGTTFNIIIPLK